MKNNIRISAKDIDLIVYDFDGVFTDNKVIVFEDGREAVICSRADGLAVAEIKMSGIPQIILSTEQNKVVQARAKKLKIKVIQRVNDKKSMLLSYCLKNNYNLKRVVYIGNDLNDYEAMKMVGYPMAPIDAHRRIKMIAKILINKEGGNGIARQLCGILKI